MNTREQLLKEMLPYCKLPSAFQESEDIINKLLKFNSISPFASILNMSSLGVNFSIELAKKGFQVTTCDFLNESIEFGKERSKEQNLSIEWINNDFFDFKRKESFDCILHLNYSFGNHLDPDIDKKMLSNFYLSLKPGGKVIIQIIGRDNLEKYFHPKHWVEVEEEIFFLNERTLDHDRSWLEEVYVIVKKGKAERYKGGMRVYYPTQACDLLESCNFKKVKMYGDVDGKVYDEQAHCLLITAEKSLSENFIRC